MKFIDQLRMVIKSKIIQQNKVDLLNVVKKFENDVAEIKGLQKQRDDLEQEIKKKENALSRKLPNGYEWDGWRNSKKIYVGSDVEVPLSTEKLLQKYDELMILKRSDEAKEVKDKIEKIWGLGQ